jgi:hypothetical protein
MQKQASPISGQVGAALDEPIGDLALIEIVGGILSLT